MLRLISLDGHPSYTMKCIRNMVSTTRNYSKCYEKCNIKADIGPVFRMTPNELSFADVNAWKDIYSHNPRDKIFLKSDFYNSNPKNHRARNIISEENIERHADRRRLVAHAFSSKALTEQEYIIAGYVDKFIERLGKRYADKEVGPGGEFCNLVDWYNYTTFDIIGDLAFGSAATFECLEKGKSREVYLFRLYSIH